MYTVKLPYYPEIIANVTETRFGFLEIDKNEIYNKALSNKIVVRVDALASLSDVIGENVLFERDKVYNILSGNYTNDVASKNFAYFYRRYNHVRKYINDVYAYGDTMLDPYELVVSPLVDKLKEDMTTIKSELYALGGKHLVETHGYIYFAFSYAPQLQRKGVTVIC